MQLGKEVLYLTQSDIVKVDLPMADIIAALEEAFIEKKHGRYEMPPKPGIHPLGDAYIHAMPCWLPKHNAAGLKWVAGYPTNQDKGLPYITGLMIMNDPETGIPICIMDCTWITAMRTGAVTGLSAKYLANPDSATLGILGCGVQGRTNLEALLVTCKNIKRVYAFDIYPEIAKKYAEEQGEKFGVEIIPVATHKEAVVDSDIVVTAGPILRESAGVIEASWLKKGAMLAPVDFDCMFKPKVIENTATKYFVDDLGQYQGFRRMGYFPHGYDAPTEICEVIAGTISGRDSKEEIVAAVNIGMALDDIPTATLIIKKAQQNNIGTILPL